MIFRKKNLLLGFFLAFCAFQIIGAKTVSAQDDCSITNPGACINNVGNAIGNIGDGLSDTFGAGDLQKTRDASITDFGDCATNFDDGRCSCQVIFRNQSDRSDTYRFNGHRCSNTYCTNESQEMPIIVLDSTVNWEFAMLATGADHDHDDNCKMERSISRDTYREDDLTNALVGFGEGFMTGCTAGGTSILFAPLGCVPGAGIGIGTAINNVGIHNVIDDEWSSVDSTEEYECLWDEDAPEGFKNGPKTGSQRGWRLIGFYDLGLGKLKEGNKFEHIGRLQFLGTRAREDRPYCQIAYVGARLPDDQPNAITEEENDDRIDQDRNGDRLEFIEGNVCDQVPGDDADISTPRGKCQACEDSDGFWTAVGCIPTEIGSMVREVIRIGLSIGGGIALLMILVGAFTMTVSRGDPKRINESREVITSAIIGLLFVIFSITLLRFIGITLFQLPGLGG